MVMACAVRTGIARAALGAARFVAKIISAQKVAPAILDQDGKAKDWEIFIGNGSA